MLVSVEKLPNERIIVVQYNAPFEPNQDISAAQSEIAALLDENEGVFFRIDDLSKANMTWQQFVDGIFVATREVPGSMVDARIRGVLVGDDEMIQLASASMKQQQYGATNTPVFASLDEALAHARQELSLPSSS
ncbi:MAG: hypothetical protein AAF125_13180 [Chloroflexota bacterium]